MVADKENAISSIATSKVEIQRIPAVEGMYLENYHLKFNSVEKDASYIVTIGGVSETISPSGYTVTNGVVSINLKNYTSILNKISKTQNTTVFISAQSDSDRTQVDSFGRLNSKQSEKTFFFNAKPANVKLDGDGVLTFESNTFDGERNFTIVIEYGSEKRVITETLDRVVDSGAEGEPAPQSESATYYTFSIDLLPYIIGGDSILDSNGTPTAMNYPSFIGKNAKITILENNTSRFDGEVSDGCYVYMMPSVKINKVLTTSGLQAIKFNAVTGLSKLVTVKYILSVNDGEGVSKLADTEIPLKSILPNEVGEYIISLILGYSKEDIDADTASANPEGSKDNPYVIVKDEICTDSITISAKSQSLATTVAGSDITWEGIDGATYTVEYKTPSSSTWAKIEKNIDSNSCEIATRLPNAGSYNVKVTPIVDYIATGIYLIDSIKEDNTVTKLNTPISITTEGGKLVFSVQGIDGLDVVVNLKINGTDLVKDTDYKVKSEVIKDGSDNYSHTKFIIDEINPTFEGLIDISIGISLVGYIDSAYATVNQTIERIAAPEIEKSGNKIYWKPNAKANEFLLTYNGSEDGYRLLIDTDGKYKVFKATTSSGDSGTDAQADDETSAAGSWVEDATMFGFENGRLYFVFDESLVTGLTAGDYTVNIQQFTNTENYINSAKSADYVITKLESKVTVTPSADNTSRIIISGYTPVNETKVPTKVMFKIERYEVEETEGSGTESQAEGGSSQPVVTILETYTLDAPIEYSSFIGSTVGEGENATPGYFIDFDLIGLTEAGTYRIFVVFIGNGDSADVTFVDNKISTSKNNNILTSEVCMVDGLEKLAPTTLRTESGVLVYGDEASVNAGATTYSIKVNDSDVTNDLTVDEDSNKGVVSYKFTAGTVYSVQVRNNGTGKISSTWSEPFKVMKLQAPNTLTIYSSDAGKVMVKWVDPNENIGKFNYILNYHRDMSGEETEDYNLDDPINNTDLHKLVGAELITDLKVNTYDLSMKVIGTSTTTGIGLLSSDFSSTVVANYIANICVPEVINGGLSWSKINGATKYKITMTSTDGTIIKYTTDTFYNFKESDINEVGIHDIVIDAITDPTVSIISSTAENANTTSLYVTPQITNFKVVNGNLTWTIADSVVEDFVTANSEKLVKSTILQDHAKTLPQNEQDNLKEVVTSYVSGIIDLGVEKLISQKTELESALSFMYSFNMKINGIETTVYADKVEKKTSGLLFSYEPRLTAEIYQEQLDAEGKPTDDIVVEKIKNNNTEPGKYELSISSKGNTLIAEKTENTPEVVDDTESTPTPSTEIAVVSSKYTTKLTVYKPNTPTTWTRIDEVALEEGSEEENPDGEGSEEGGEEPEEPTEEEEETVIPPRGIVNGNILWNLVTNADSYIEEELDEEDNPTGNMIGHYYYHKDYVITAYPENNQDHTGTPIKITVGEFGTDTNWSSDDKYYKHVKDLFYTEGGESDKAFISANTNYNLKINVAGTADSDEAIANGEKIYLNSDKFLYPNVVNILKNQDMGVRESQFDWSVSPGSTATKVVIYGPFKYAPIDKEDLDEANKGISDPTLQKTTKDLLNEWRNGSFGADYDTSRLYPNKQLWDDLVNNNYSPEKETLQTPRMIGKIFKFKKGINELSITKEIESYINDEGEFGAGGYIIRKQELGDNRGIIDTDVDWKTHEVGDVDYEFVVNKLDKVTPITTTRGSGENEVKITSWLGQLEFNNSNETIATQGMFVWNAVPRATAYKVVLITNDGHVDKPSDPEYVYPSADGTVRYDVPDRDVNGLSYRLQITAVKINGEEQLMDDYFSGDMETTDSYNRVDTPINLSITGDGEITWTQGGQEVSAYIVKINDGEGNCLEYVGFVDSNDQVLLNIGDMDENATFNISIKAIGKMGLDLINSSYTGNITITKLGAPEPKIENGNFTWGPIDKSISEGNPTDTRFSLAFGNTQVLSEVLTSDIYTYPLYTDISTYSQNYNLSSEEYKAGSYTFTIQYIGTEGVVTKERNYIVSRPDTYTVEKLSAPVVQATKNTGDDNKIEWAPDPDNKATAYKVLLISADDKRYSEIVDLDNTTLLSVTADKVTLNLTEFLNRTDTSEFKNKLTTGVKVYIQAVGTMDSSAVATKFVNSSYSDCCIYKTPSPAKNGSYNKETGTISWELEDEDKKDYNVSLTTTYKVSGVSVDDYNNYWAMSIGSDNDILKALNILSRSISATSREVGDGDEKLTVYDLVVTDRIYLTKDKKGNTPTSYALTNYGTEYAISIEVISDYTSQNYEFTTYDDDGAQAKINFNLFNGGDGSAYLPYKIETVEAFDSIRNFTNRHFVINKDLDFSSFNYETISSFSGVIDGNGHKLNNISPRVSSTSTSTDVYLSLIKNNSGTIKNLEINIALDYSTTGTIIASAVAVTNTNTIENVKVTGYMFGLSSFNPVYIGGISVFNMGTISGCTVELNGKPNSDTTSRSGIYAESTSQSGQSMVAGIAIYNGFNSIVNKDNNNPSAMISDCHFNGNLTANFVGGIAYESCGIVDKCSSNGTAVVDYQGRTSVLYGGVVGNLFNGATITNSYSQLATTIKLASNVTGAIGGLVGKYSTLSALSDTTRISGCYVVVSMTFEGTSNRVYAYAFMPGSSSITYENNIYYTKKLSGVSVLSNDNISNLQTVVTQNENDAISAINTALKNVKDITDSSKNVYNVDASRYPIHA